MSEWALALGRLRRRRSDRRLAPCRFTLTWPDDTLSNTWRRVTLAATPSNGLTESDIFYFGSAVGETGVGNLSNVILVDGVDRMRRVARRRSLDVAAVDRAMQESESSARRITSRRFRTR
ncbi:MAG: hypothetical protein IIA67_00800 [Planctomycetes bacterium]|nr:hypothetical protein [Planctomycetota bacterium]